MENVFRIELNIFGIFIVLIVIWLFYKQIKNKNKENKNKENKIFLSLTYFILIELILDSIFWIVDSKQFFLAREINFILNTIYYFFQILQCYVWMWYCEIYLQCTQTRRKQYILFLPFLMGVILLFVNLWTGCVFTVNEYNVYKRSWGFSGTMEAMCCLFYSCYCFVLIILKMIQKDKKEEQAGGYLLLASIVPVISAIIQMLIYGLNFIWVGMAMASLLILVEIELKQYQKMENELAEQRIQIMLSQIQPHFLYNSLTAIAYLCDTNPKKAKKATVDFSRYLRVNLDSIKQKNPTPFEKELDHIKIYLSLEKMRFEEELTIVYDIKTTDFLVPALAIQPLVENAVKYGVGQKIKGGTVWLITKEDEDYFIVIIADDGIGFDPYRKQYDGRTHIGIENVKRRLSEMCEGSLEIESILNKGTTVTVKIPKRGKKNEL